ncbi:MAG: hypothetical protein AAF288_12405 [Planctomycetota bacterium]
MMQLTCSEATRLAASGLDVAGRFDTYEYRQMMRIFTPIEFVYRNLWLAFLALAVVVPVIAFGEVRGWLVAEPDTTPLPNQNRMLGQLLLWLLPAVLHLALLACALMLKPKGLWFWMPASTRKPMAG